MDIPLNVNFFGAGPGSFEDIYNYPSPKINEPENKSTVLLTKNSEERDDIYDTPMST